MSCSIKISKINVYHPLEIRMNDYYVNRHSNIKNIENLFDEYGKNKRNIANYDSENVLTMAIEAAKPIAETDIDIILFASTTMEYLSPTHAIFLHRALGVKNNCVCIDMNTNCLGMLTIFEQAAMMLSTKAGYRKALIVSADHLTRYLNPKDLLPLSLFGDAGVAMLLEKVDDNLGAGLIDSLYFTNSEYADTVVFPRHGLSHSQNMQDEKFLWGKFTGAEGLTFAIDGITTLLNQHQLQVSDIRCFFFSQLSKSYIQQISRALNITDHQIEYIADQCGYTGANSVFVAYNSRRKKSLLKEGDIIVFWSIGSGFQSSILLWKI